MAKAVLTFTDSGPDRVGISLEYTPPAMKGGLIEHASHHAATQALHAYIKRRSEQLFGDELRDIGARMAQQLLELFEDAEQPNGDNPLAVVKDLVDEWEALHARIEADES